ncbi:hypothetical protein G9A89_014204 [Geosiphon pyriformis]|nr:hypothetical protein G9A89_014204 [Geosiphon pyriformis]
MSEESDFQQTALFKGKVAATRSNPSNNTILPAQIAQNINLSDIFPFEFEANKSPFLLSNTAVNEQKTITAMYTEAKISWKYYYLSVNATALKNSDNIKKTSVREIDNFPFTINGITIPVKVLVMDALQYQTNANLDWKTQELKISYQGQYTKIPAICDIFNKRFEKASVFEFKEKKKLPITKTFMALGLTSSWAEKTEQEIFKETKE